MSTFKDFYDILKDLIGVAKNAKNQEILTQALDLQEKYFELREENDSLKQENKELLQKIESLEKVNVIEQDITYSEKGYFTIKKETPKIPYCSMCWKKDHLLIPLSQKGSWWQYRCGNCKTDCVVMNSNGKPLNTTNE